MVARHVSDLNGPSSGVFSSCMLQIWYVVFCVLLNMSRCYAVVGRTSSYNQNMLSHQTLWVNLIIKHCASCWITYILQDDTWSIQYQGISLLWLCYQTQVKSERLVKVFCHDNTDCNVQEGTEINSSSCMLNWNYAMWVFFNPNVDFENAFIAKVVLSFYNPLRMPH